MELKFVIGVFTLSPFICLLFFCLFFLLIYVNGTGVLFYPTSTVELRYKEIVIKKRKSDIIIPERDILFISYACSRSSGKQTDAPIYIYYRITLKNAMGKRKKIYFQDYVPNPPKIGFLEFDGYKKIDRSKEFMTLIKTGKKKIEPKKEQKVAPSFLDQFKI